MKFCPECGAGAAATASQSSSDVDRDVEHISREAATFAENQSDSRKFCSSCGGEENADSSFCGDCGAAIEPCGLTPAPPPSTSASVSQSAHSDLANNYFSSHTILRHPKSGKLKVIKNGWSWSLCFLPHMATVIALSVLSAWTFSFIEWIYFLMLFSCISWGISIFLGVKGSELSARNYTKQGWQRIDPTSLTEQELSAHMLRDLKNKVLLGVAAYQGVKLAAVVAKIPFRAGSAIVDGLHGRSASTGNPARDVAIAEKHVADAELRFSRGTGSYEDIARAKSNLAYRKEKLYR